MNQICLMAGKKKQFFFLSASKDSHSKTLSWQWRSWIENLRFKTLNVNESNFPEEEEEYQSDPFLKRQKMELLKLSKFKLQLQTLITEFRELKVRLSLSLSLSLSLCVFFFFFLIFLILLIFQERERSATEQLRLLNQVFFLGLIINSLPIQTLRFVFF